MKRYKIRYISPKKTEKSFKSLSTSPLLKDSKQIIDKWSMKALNALDTDNKGYIYKDEIMDELKAGGVYEHHCL